MPKLSLMQARLVVKFVKKAHRTMDFVQYEGSRGVLRVLHLPYLIIKTWLRVVGLRIVSVDQLSTFWHQNMSPGRHHIDISKELSLVNICEGFAMLRNIRGFG